MQDEFFPVAALDVGYGETKVSWLTRGQPVCKVFRSQVEQASSLDLGAGALGKRRTIVVEVEGVEYEVGNDANLVSARPSEGVLHDQYIETADYMALVKAAFATMGCTRIGLLVTGLPVSHLSKYRDQLAKLLQGEHTGCGGQTVTVDRVIVLPQPLGGMMDYRSKKGAGEGAKLDKQGVIIVDVGTFTTDFLLAIRGKAAPARSGSTPHGVAEVLSSVRDALLAKYKGAPHTSAIADAIKAGEATLYCAGKEVDTQPFVAAAVAKVGNRIMRDVSNRVGATDDIDRGLIVGGGATLFRALIAEQLSLPNVDLVAHPGFSNVRGYLSYGAYLSQREKTAAAAGGE